MMTMRSHDVREGPIWHGLQRSTPYIEAWKMPVKKASNGKWCAKSLTGKCVVVHASKKQTPA